MIEIDNKKKLQIKQEKINADARQYLLDTDWYVVRFSETAIEIPSDILEARKVARDSIK